MPTYEMPTLLRVLNKTDTAKTLKRIAYVIFEHGGFIRKLENLGQHPTPFKCSIPNYPPQHAAHYFVFFFDAPPRRLEEMMDIYSRDLDIVRNRIFKSIDPKAPLPPCTFHDEMLPVPFRPSVQKLMKIAEKTKPVKPKFNPNTGLDYYPFQR